MQVHMHPHNTTYLDLHTVFFFKQIHLDLHFCPTRCKSSSVWVGHSTKASTFESADENCLKLTHRGRSQHFKIYQICQDEPLRMCQKTMHKTSRSYSFEVMMQPY